MKIQDLSSTALRHRRRRLARKLPPIERLLRGYLKLSALYDINTASTGNTGLYQVIARNPATAPAVATLLGGPGSPGNGYTSGNYLYVDWTATKKFGKWEFGAVAYGSTDLSRPIASYEKQGQFAVGGCSAMTWPTHSAGLRHHGGIRA